jgi:hypothetical protein
MKKNNIAPYLLAAATTAAGCGGNVENHYHITNVFNEGDAGDLPMADGGVEIDGQNEEEVVDAEANVFLTRRQFINDIVYNVMKLDKSECENPKYLDVDATDELCHAIEIVEKRLGDEYCFFSNRQV